MRIDCMANGVYLRCSMLVIIFIRSLCQNLWVRSLWLTRLFFLFYWYTNCI